MKYIISTILVLALLIMGYFWENNTPENIKNISPVHTPTVVTETPIEKQIKSAHPDTHFIMAETGEEKETHEVEPHRYEPFSEEDIDDTKLILKPMQNIEPVSAIRMEEPIIKNAKVGDILVLPSIDGVTYELTVTHRTVSKNGNVSIHGTFEENGVNYHSMVTEGGNMTLISFSTPTGSYEAELKKGLGYVYASADIENENIDYSQSDVIEEIDTKVEEEK